MKKLIYILFILMIGCKVAPVLKTEKPIVVIIYDTILVYDTITIYADDIRQLNELKADVEFWKDSVHILNTTIPLEVYENSRKIEKIKYYIAITEKKPQNKTFFYGWIRRTILD